MRFASLTRPQVVGALFGALVLLSFGLIAGYVIGRPPAPVRAHFVPLSSTAHCRSRTGQTIYTECVAVGIFRNEGGPGTALVTFQAFQAIAGSTGGTGACTTALPRTATGDVVEVSCPLAVSRGEGIYMGLPDISEVVTGP